MLDRSELKRKAKDVLSYNYWNPFGAGMIVSIIAVVLEYVVGCTGRLAPVVILAVSLFLLNPISVGYIYYHLECRYGKYEIGNLFNSLSNGYYMNTVGTIFVTNLIVSLWSLLILPGIYFSYAYYFVPYICADHPEVSSSEARRLSKIMTDGYKLDIFILELSFIGWTILALVTVVGVFFLVPYMQATYAELYVELRDTAIMEGRISPEEIGYGVPKTGDQVSV